MRTRPIIFLLALAALGFGLTSQGCKRRAEAGPAKTEVREVLASWYDVPESSLAKRRAHGDELTAANNRLPLGTLVRVTHIGNGKSVVVRITDRGELKKKIKIDLCKEAAEKLDMVGEGIAHVRMQVLSSDGAAEASPSA